MAEATYQRMLAIASSEIRQLELFQQELARRKRELLAEVGRSEDAPIDLTEDDLPRVGTPVGATGSSYEINVAVKSETVDEDEVRIKREAEDEDEVEVKVESGDEGVVKSQNPKRPRKRARKEPPPALYKATVKNTAQTGTATVTSSNAVVNDDIMERIKKCLARCNHPETPEHEAKIAFRIASRLMEQHNISQADVAREEGAAGQQLRSGRSVVALIRSDGNQTKDVKHYTYVDRIGSAMGKFFDCKFYTCTDIRRQSLEFVFYGIAENTITAALAFEMAYNLIAEWARPQKGFGTKNSYCLGASWQLWLMATEEKAAEEARAMAAEKEVLAAKVRQEEIEDDARLARLQPTVENEDNPADSAVLGPNDNDGNSEGGGNDVSLHADAPFSNAWNFVNAGFNGFSDDYGPQSDDDENVIEPDFVEDDEPLDISRDLDEEIRQQVQPKAISRSASPEMGPLPAVSSQQSSHGRTTQEESSGKEPIPSAEDILELEAGLESSWASHMQLMTFRADATKIADEYLKDHGVKLGKGRNRSSIVRDRGAYEQGKEDGKKIDVHQVRLKEEPV